MGTTAQKLQAILAAKGDIKSAIEGKGVTVGDAPLDEYASKIGEISCGQEEEYMDDVIFIDYDGKVLYRYTAQEFLALTEMPANPSHEGLTSQGWNWTLAGAKNYVGKYGKIVIGHTYITTDEKTRLFITLDNPDWLAPTFALSPYSNTSFVIDWGDGSSPQNLPAGRQSITHTFPSVGDYVITITASSNGGKLGGGTAMLPLIYSLENYSAYTGILRKVYMGKLISLTLYCFYDQRNLIEISSTYGISSSYMFANCGIKAFVIPASATGAGNSVFDHSALEIISFSENFSLTAGANLFSFSSVKRIDLPAAVGSRYNGLATNAMKLKSIIFTDAFISIADCDGCMSLENVICGDNITTIGANAFRSCHNLYGITIGSNVTTIGNTAFQNARLLRYVHIGATTPPSLSASAFSEIVGLYKIYVPASSVETYKTATNWNAYADKIFAEPT